MRKKSSKNLFNLFGNFFLNIFEAVFYVIPKAIRKLTFWTALILFIHLKNTGAFKDFKILAIYLIFCIFVVSQKMAVDLLTALKGTSIKYTDSKKDYSSKDVRMRNFE